MTPAALGERLAAEGLVADPMLPFRADADPSPWFVKALAAAGAWLAALLAYGSAAALLWPVAQSAPARVAVGALVCAGCAAIIRRRGDDAGIFLPQLLLAISLAGFLFAASGGWEAVGAPELVLAAFAAVLLLVNPEPIHRQLMALVAVGSLSFLATRLHLGDPLVLLLAAAAVLLWSLQPRWAAAGLGPLLAPVAVAVTAGLVLLPGVVTEPFLRSALPGSDGLRAWPAWSMSGGLAVALAAALLGILRQEPRSKAGPAWLRPATVAAAALVAVAAGSAPGVIACLLAWVLAMAAGRGTLAALALAALAWYLARLYYGLETTLLGKAIALIATGVVLLGLHFVVRWLGRSWPPIVLAGQPMAAADRSAGVPAGATAATAAPRAQGDAADRRPALRWLLLAAGALLVFGGFNRAVLQKEALLRDGAVLRLALAPVDPRALMTGDYMALNYAVAAPIARGLSGRDGFAILAPDGQGVGRLVRVQAAPEPRAAGELAVRARHRNGRVRIGTDAWYFQEGHAARYEAARFGEFRVGDDGEVVLVRLLDESLRPLGSAPQAGAR